MTVIYIDSFLLINFCVNYLLLLAAAKLSGEVLFRFRFALSAAFGACYAALAYFPAFHIFLHPIYKAGSAILMILIAFGGTKRILRMAMIFLALSCAFGGSLYAFTRAGAVDGVLYSALDVKGLLIAAALFYAILTLCFRRASIHSRRELHPVVLSNAGEKAQLTALCDSGNTLMDPLTGRPILVVEGTRLQHLFPDVPLDRDTLAHPIETLKTLDCDKNRMRFRLLPYRAVGVECGMLLAVRMDRVIVDGETYEDYLVALSPTPLSDGGGYNALIGCRS